MPSYSPSSIRRRYQFPFPKSNLKCLYPILIAFIALHFFWICYDEYITSHQRYRPKRKPVKVTESSPLSPFYSAPVHNEYNGSRVFPIYNNSFPCGELMDEAAIRTRADAKEGLFYVKEIETSSTIFSSVTARIARNMGRQQQQQQLDSSVANGNTNNVTGKVCSTRVVSQRARRFRGRSIQKSFLWSVVAEPVGRLISKYYHYADSKQQATITDKRQITSRFQDFVLHNENQDYGYYFRSLSVKQNLNPYNMVRQPYIREILDSYDFLGISERMDESLVVLMIILGLEIQDVLYLSTPKAISKDSSSSSSSSSTNYYENWKKDQCRPIPIAEVTLEMKQWFYSEEFEAFIEADVLFYKAVNKSLDATIDNLGKQRVEKAVKQLQMAQSQVKKMCQNVRFPCSSEGKFQKETDCFFSNIGCGYECLDNVGQSLKNLD